MSSDKQNSNDDLSNDIYNKKQIKSNKMANKTNESVHCQIVTMLTVGVLILSSLLFYLNLDIQLLMKPQNQQSKTSNHQHNVPAIGIHPDPVMANVPVVKFLDSKSDIHIFNKRQLSPRLNSLINLDYFRYVKVNLNRPCSLWCNNNKCNSRDCKVKTLSDTDKCPIETYDEGLSTVNTDLANDQLDLLINGFECNDHDDHDSKYVDLLKNPERYTGYTGESANQVWRAIYEENCFIRKSHSPFNEDLCYEERLFYEAISGLHSSISIHLCAEYPSIGLIGSFEPNVEEFLRRFEGHNDYLENLYTLFLLELKALTRSGPYLLNQVNWPENSLKHAMKDLLGSINKYDIPTFGDLSLKPSHVSNELAVHFRNITTTIMDCVACDKCKLWGKVQLRGLGAAFKILSVRDLNKLYLNHQEIASLVNAIARLSHSIRQLDNFKNLVTPGHKSVFDKHKQKRQTQESNNINIRNQVI